MRLNKYLSESGAWSRREADALIEEGRVTVNGVPAGLGAVMADGAEVKVDGNVVGVARKLARPVYIALNKPVGITCTTERHVEGNIIDFVDHAERIFPIGRLDKESEGLILLTNDGDVVNGVLRSEHNHEKEYLVAVDHPVTDELCAQLARGVRLDDGYTKPAKVRKVGPRVFCIVLTQGLNRQIRRMCEALRYRVVALQRIRIMHVELGNLKVGRWRNLSEREVAGLLQPAPSKAIPRPTGPAPAPRRAEAPRRVDERPARKSAPRHAVGNPKAHAGRPSPPKRGGGGGRRGRG